MTLGEMKAQFIALMNRNELRSTAPAGVALVNTFVSQAILRIQRELRVPMMEQSILYTIPLTYVANTGLEVPSDLLELIGLFIGDDQEYELQREQATRVKSLAKCVGDPRKFTRIGGNWIIGPAPAVGSKIFIQYYAAFPAFASDSDVNTLSEVAADAVVYGALGYACDFYSDPRVKQFEERYSQILLNIQAMADGDELTADAAVSPVYPWPQDF